MFDIGGPELILVAVVALIVIGPKELPGAIRTVTMWVRRARGLAMEFRAGVDEMVREAELDQMRDELKSHIDPDNIGGSIKDDLERSIDPDGDLADMKEDLDLEGDWYSPEESVYEYAEDDAEAYQANAERSYAEEQAREAEEAAARAGGEDADAEAVDGGPAEPAAEPEPAPEKDDPAPKPSGAGAA
jgi:sec-independent protein translocase protein TatB